MSNNTGIPVTKPVAIWKKEIKVSFRDLFKSVGKAAVDASFGKWDSLAGDAVDTLGALGLSADTGQVAWLLIYRSLMLAMRGLVEGNKDLVIRKVEEIDFKSLFERLDKVLQNTDLNIDQNFFERPKALPIIEVIKTPFAQWLEETGFNQAQAQTISNRLPSYFVDALNELWGNNPQDYASLKEKLDTPFTKASEREQRWRRYLAWLQKQVEEPMFLEAFSLKQVYIPLLAYYQRKDETNKDEEFERRGREDEKYERVVVDLETELEAWLKEGDPHDAIRVISGGPGSGKSSFAKIFAANQAEKGEYVLFIPLHHFKPSDDLVDAVGKFVRDDGFLRHNPLEQDQAESRLIIIFDALDELAMQGKIATEIAQQFVREVQRKLERFNVSRSCLKVLISGRELVVQANSSDFRKPQQVLHILPYFVTKHQREDYVDGEKLLATDKRQYWWNLYSEASGKNYTGLPPELDQGKLTEITAQPLLNYLVALSFVRGKVNFSEDSNLNAIYEDLLKAVYERGWTGYQHPSIQGIAEKDFIRILEEIALASWHGNGRTTTVKEIEFHCENSGLKRLLDIFQEGAKLGVTRLLAAFYFRQSGANNQGDKTFEFTHKSFGEYLTAKRIVREVRLIHKKLEERKNDPDEGWDERDGLHRWIILSGASAMDAYLFDFVVDEVRLQKSADVENWQQTLCNLIGFMLHHGMPMERLNPRPDFQEENRQSRNAEEALLAVLNACARLTKKVSEIKWHSPEAFGMWISRLHGQRVDYANEVFCLNCLSFLDLQNCNLIGKDFDHVNLERANLVEVQLAWADLVEANLQGANLGGANLVRADLIGADLERANLQGADLERANLEGADLEWANLIGADLQEANLQEANLQEANLQGANLQGANLADADLQEANLQRANLGGVNLVEAYLADANLVRADLADANLKWANLQGANLQEANLEGANLADANLADANLVGAEIEWPKLLPDHFEPEEADSSDNPPQP